MSTGAQVAARSARAKTRNVQVRRAAGQEGFVLDPSQLPRTGLPTDRVPPLLAFVVYGVPAPQGSKRAFVVNGKARMKESSAGVDPWRQAVRMMVLKVISQWNKTHSSPWEPLDEPVVVSVTVTLPGNDAASHRGDRYASVPPDLDKLQRALGDAISPVPVEPSVGKGMAPNMKKRVRAQVAAERAKKSLLKDDSRIVSWDECTKVYPATTPTSLGYPGVLVRLWRLSDLEAYVQSGVHAGSSTAGELRDRYMPVSGGWGDVPIDGGMADGDVSVTSDGHLTAAGAQTVLSALVFRGAGHRLRVTVGR